MRSLIKGALNMTWTFGCHTLVKLGAFVSSWFNLCPSRRTLTPMLNVRPDEPGASRSSRFPTGPW